MQLQVSVSYTYSCDNAQLGSCETVARDTVSKEAGNSGGAAEMGPAEGTAIPRVEEESIGAGHIRNRAAGTDPTR